MYLKKIERELLTFKSGNPKPQPNFNRTSHTSWAIKPFGIYDEIWDSEPQPIPKGKKEKLNMLEIPKSTLFMKESPSKPRSTHLANIAKYTKDWP